jgi:Bacterial Ig-like domain (group 3)
MSRFGNFGEVFSRISSTPVPVRNRIAGRSVCTLVLLGMVAAMAAPAPAYALLLPSTTTLSSSANPSTIGASVTFTATVATVIITPTGTVTFKDGATTLGTGTLNGSGQATFSTSSLALGSHSITAVYSGDLVYNPSTSSTLSQTVNQNNTTTTVGSTPNPGTFGASVTFTATVSSVVGTPTGTVTFKDGAITLGTGTLSGGQATFTTSALAVGSHSITAVYGGDTNDIGGTSAVLTQTVTQASSSTGVTASANPATFGSTVTFTSKQGAQLTMAGEFGGLGSAFDIWSVRARITVPF